MAVDPNATVATYVTRSEGGVVWQLALRRERPSTWRFQ